MEKFHCVLITEIPTFPFSSDHISVWKQTKTVYGKESHFQDESEEIEEESSSSNVLSTSDAVNNDEEADGDEGDEEADEEDDDKWRSIPPDEVLSFHIAAPAFAHLLS